MSKRMSNREKQHSPGPDDSGQDHPWEACPTGELTHMVQRLDAKQNRARRKQIYGTALLSSAVFAGIVLAVGSLMGPGGNGYGGIRCAECRDHFTDYQLHIAGEQMSNDAEFLLSMKTHLEKCTFCREKFNALYPDHRVANAAAMRPAITFALQPMFAIGHQPTY